MEQRRSLRIAYKNAQVKLPLENNTPPSSIHHVGIKSQRSRQQKLNQNKFKSKVRTLSPKSVGNNEVQNVESVIEDNTLSSIALPVEIIEENRGPKSTLGNHDNVLDMSNNDQITKYFLANVIPADIDFNYIAMFVVRCNYISDERKREILHFLNVKKILFNTERMNFINHWFESIQFIHQYRERILLDIKEYTTDITMTQ